MTSRIDRETVIVNNMVERRAFAGSGGPSLPRSANRMRPIHLLIAAPLALLSVCAAASAAPVETVIYNFPSTSTYGFFPEATLAFGTGGTLYGEAKFGGIGGTSGSGLVFKLSPPAAAGKPWTSKLVHEFTGAPDGQYPEGGLIVTSASSLFGVAHTSGKNAGGTAFQIAPGGAFTVLHAFAASVTDGVYPSGSLAVDATGDLFGATNSGGPASGAGTVFELKAPASANGPRAYATIYSIPLNSSTNGYGATLSGITIINGVLYGTTVTNGSGSAGTVYSLTPPAKGATKWTPTILYNFNGLSTGAYPFANVIAGPGGTLLGTTISGGSHSLGVIYQLTPPATAGKPWTETVLYNFTGAADGANPLGKLTPDGKGSYYGTAAGGGKTGPFSCSIFPEFLPVQGQAGCGTVYKITAPATGKKWTFSTVYEFAGAGFTGKIKDASSPVGGVILSPSGIIYGTGVYGGTATSAGAVFQITP
jgi:hypothetical protein